MKTKFKSIFALAAVVILSGAMLFYGCKKPNDDLTYYINSAVFTYTASLKFQDPSNGNALPPGLTLTLVGANAKSVYDFSGLKALKLNGSTVTMGLDPSITPTTGKDIAVTVLAEAPGFRDENITITFSADGNATLPLRTVNMLNLVKVSPGVAISSQTSTVTAGVVAAPIIGTTPASSNATQTATVTIPTGTQLRDAAGVVVPTGSATLSVVNLDVEKPSSAQFLPGVDLVQNAVVNGVSQTVAFTPAAVTTVELFAANGTEIKNFSQPITVRVSLDPTTINPITDAPIQAGDGIDFYSYDAAKDLWTLESTGVVQSAGGSLFTNLSVTHLTTFISTLKGKNPCSNFNTITFTGTSGYLPPTGSTDIFTVLVFYTNTKGKKDVAAKLVGISTTENQVKVKGTQGTYTVQVSDIRGNVVGTQNFTNCPPSATMPLNITAPSVDFPTMTIYIEARCASGQLKANITSTAPPGLVVQYRETGSTTWINLGSVNNSGELITNVLNRNKTYDFQTFVSQNLPGAPNGLLKGWTGVKINDTGLQTPGNNLYGTSLGSIFNTTVQFEPDNKKGKITIVYQVNPILCN